MEDKKLPRREREKLAQRQEMLAAALELFSGKGYRNVSMRDRGEGRVRHRDAVQVLQEQGGPLQGPSPGAGRQVPCRGHEGDRRAR